MTEAEHAAGPAPGQLFAGVYFAVINGGCVDDERAASLIADLENNGGVHCRLDSTELRNLTHLIADDYDFPAYQDAIDGYIHVVRPLWVEQSIIKNKLANLHQHRPDPRLFMKDVVYTFADDIPPGDQDAISGGMHAMGGIHSGIMTKLVTHVVALTMESRQVKIVQDKNLKCRILLPHWFDHCFTLGKKIDEAPYTLPNPPITDERQVHRPCAVTNSDSLAGAILLEPLPRSPISPSKARRELDVFRGRNVLLSKNLEIEQHLKTTLSDLIHEAKGQNVSDIDSADIVICKTRSGLDFTKALDNHKDVGNLNWLYHLLNTNRWTSPTRRLLHYPLPHLAITGFKDFRISVSNYTGEARIYLENLIKAAGGTFTKTMTQTNTHLITAHDQSEKVEAAREWEIATINHLWLEESYAKCKVQSMTNQKYTTFPAKTNLGEVVGQVQIDRRILEETFLPHRFASPEPAPPSSVLEPRSSNARTSTSPLKPRKAKSIMTPAHVGKENATPGSRGAKERAINKLHTMAGDIVQFQKEMKRKGGVIHGGRRVLDVDHIQLPGRKRSSSAANGSDSESTGTEAPGTTNQTKHKKKRKTHEDIKFTFVVTSGETFGWGSAEKRARARALGLHEIDHVPKNNKFDVLVAPRVLRTPNFLAAVAAGVPILRPAWLEDSIKAGHCLKIDGYPLNDLESKQSLKGDLTTVLTRAREHRRTGGLLKNATIYCTENVRGGTSLMDVISRNDGTCVQYKGRETKAACNHHDGSGREAGCRKCDKTEVNDTNLYLLSVPKDKSTWGKFKTMAQDSGYKPRIVTADWILQVCLSQDLTVWDGTWDLGGAA